MADEVVSESVETTESTPEVVENNSVESQTETAENNDDSSEDKPDFVVDEPTPEELGFVSEEEATEKKDVDSDTEGEEQSENTNKPPKGYVPNEALKEERAKRKEAQAHIAELEARLAEQQTRSNNTSDTVNVDDSDYSDEVKDFAKSHPEYANLILEDSEDGQSLRDTLEAYGEHDAKSEARSISIERRLNNQQYQKQDDAMRAVDNAVLESMGRLFDGGLNGEEARGMVGHLKDQGWNDSAISLLTSPNTVITDPNTGKQFRLGGVALQLVQSLKDGYDAHRHSNPDSDKQKVAALRESIKKEVTKEVMDKMRSSSDTGKSFKDIGSVAGHEEVSSFKLPTTHSGWESLTQKQWDMLLGKK